MQLFYLHYNPDLTVSTPPHLWTASATQMSSRAVHCVCSVCSALSSSPVFVAPQTPVHPVRYRDYEFLLLYVF